MAAETHKTDVVIVGGGPVGLFQIFELGMLKISCHLVDSLDVLGGQCAALYPEKPIYDIPAWPEISGQDLVDSLVKQAEPFEPVYHLAQQVTGVERQREGGFRVTTSRDLTIECKAIVIAAGVGAFGPKRPPLPSLEAYEEAGPGQGVHYMVRRREDFRDKRIVIAGGGDSALDWTLALADIAKKIYVVHRRPKFRAAPETVAQMEKLIEKGDVVETVTPYQLHDLKGDPSKGALEAVVVKNLEDETRDLEADALLPFFGLSANLGPIAEWGLNLERNRILADPTTAETNQPGIFAIGDIASYEHKLKLILCGFSEAAFAAHSIFPLVFPGEELRWQYSTITGVPGEN